MVRVVSVYLVIMCAGCENYLDVQSNSAFEVPKSLNSLRRLLDASAEMNRSIPSIGEVSADDYFVQDVTLDRASETHQQAYYWERYEYFYNNDWAKAYFPIYTSNLVLETLPSIERTVENGREWDEVKGTSLFFKSTHYLSLLWTFAKAYDANTSQDDLGIVLRVSADPTVVSERSNVQECYEEILRGFREASELLPENTTHIMRPTKVAAFGSLARCYLAMAKYDSAYFYVNKALQIKSDLLDFNSLEDVAVEESYPFSRFSKETVSYFELVTLNPTIQERYAFIDTLLVNSYLENDLRKKAYFDFNDQGYATFKGSYAAGAVLFGGIAVDELYLMRSECNARLGNLSAALDDLNLLLNTRFIEGTFIPYSDTSQQDLLKIILQERRKELVFRGLRWMDLKRLNQMGADIDIVRNVDGETFTLRANENRWALPLPTDIIRETGMEQNPI